jgi:hypothetical protein
VSQLGRTRKTEIEVAFSPLLLAVRLAYLQISFPASAKVLTFMSSGELPCENRPKSG